MPIEGAIIDGIETRARLAPNGNRILNVQVQLLERRGEIGSVFLAASPVRTACHIRERVHRGENGAKISDSRRTFAENDNHLIGDGGPVPATVFENPDGRAKAGSNTPGRASQALAERSLRVAERSFLNECMCRCRNARLPRTVPTTRTAWRLKPKARRVRRAEDGGRVRDPGPAGRRMR